MCCHKIQKQNRVDAGFTLVELMVSVTLFTIAMLISISTLLVVMDANNKAQAVNTAMTNISFAIDSMAREIRTGHTHHCRTGMTSLPDDAQDCTGGNSIAFTREVDNERIGYRLFGTVIEQQGLASGGWLPVTSPDVIVDRFVVNVSGSDSASDGDDEQPEISIIIEGHVEDGPDSQTAFSLQTKVTQRVIDL